MTGLTVVCVDANATERDATTRAFEDAGHDAIGCSSVADAVDALGANEVDCLVTEYGLPDGTGLDLAARLRDLSPDVPCVLFTSESPNAIRTEQCGDVVVEYLPKELPEARSSLVRLVENVASERTQVGYPLPPDENERLAAISQYDRPGMAAADAFDRLTELARTYFGVDVAFVGLIDAHEERFLACAGADWETLTREDSMCTHTILEDDMMVVEDVGSDPRFADNDRLVELDIEAYAGVPLETAEGATIGAFCLTHDAPREFTEEDLADLRRFADEAMEQLELRRELAECEGANGSGKGGDNE
jgi:CheY-like chemotaxis protein